MVCTCKEWPVNIKKINSFIKLSYVRNKRDYDGVPFRYCPWCGQLLALKVFRDTRDNFHPYECGGNQTCIHCRGDKTETHDPATCALCNFDKEPV